MKHSRIKHNPIITYCTIKQEVAGMPHSKPIKNHTRMSKRVFLTLVAGLLVISAFAAELTLHIHKTNHLTQQFAVSNIDSITIHSNDSLLSVFKKDGSVTTVEIAVIDSMTYSEAEYTLPQVATLSADFQYENGHAICSGNVISDGGCPITERGICWSTSQTPTIRDSKYTSGITTGHFYALMQGLALNGTYYARAYATNGLGTSYGSVIKVQPMMGRVTYTLAVDSATYPNYYNLLKTALDSACYYYNRYTSFKANIYIYYNSGIPTAQANYHGSIGFGSNTSYMWVGTTMHEMAHFFGSGTSTVWKSKMVNGIWQGTAGQSLCQQLTGSTLKGDNSTNAVHYWPTGINYRSEVSSVTDLINHAKIIQAMLVVDCGLPTSW